VLDCEGSSWDWAFPTTDTLTESQSMADAEPRRFEHGAVCSPLTLASEAGLEVLRTGGNAVDAAIATNLALAVAYPHMCGVGGDLLAQVWANGTLHGLNSSGRLPVAAKLPADGVPERGPLSATVPGAPAGWIALAERFGTRPIEELVRPAVDLARGGVQRSPGLRRGIARYGDVLDAEGREIFLSGNLLVQPDLARTLETIGEFNTGEVAKRAPAPFSPADFANHSVEWVEPVVKEFFGVRVCELPPNSRGYLALEYLARLEDLNGLSPIDSDWHAALIRAVFPAKGTGDTIYLCAADENGMCVSLNQSLYMGFGSGVVVPKTGVVLHNRGAYHTPSSYRGGEKPIHTLAPAMCLRDERPELLFGTMGGEAQVQIHLQLLTRIFVAGQNLAEAIADPRWTLKEGILAVENGLPDLTGLVELPIESMSYSEDAGHAHAIRIGDGYFEAATDPRSDGEPVGF
jgi:gamma-glutamyltranspeptidase / glutathione hydrolase